MVSLQPNNMSTGAQYMNVAMGDARGISNTSDTSGAIGHSDVEPILASMDNGHFKKLRTIPVFSIHLLISTIISFVGIFLTTLWPESKHNEAYFIMTSLRVGFWLLTFLFDHLVRKHHNELRLNGYLDFHRSICGHNGVALSIVSGWNTLLLLAQCLDSNPIWKSWITPIACILAFQLTETFVLFTAHGIYIVTVRKFNKNEHYPDALRGTNSSAGSLGLMQPGGNVTELLEKQADLIAYLKDHNQILNRRLHQLLQAGGDF